MADNVNQQETIRCSRCKKRFFADGFKVNRLGRRLKTCLECNERVKAEGQRYKCPHGRQRSLCRECDGVGICPHDRQRPSCHECGGSALCEHNRRRIVCRDCGGVSICAHGRQRHACWECDPVSTLWKRANIRIVMAIGTKARAGRSTALLLGCDKATFYRHIEAQFKDGMNWARIAEIEIDHIVPISYRGVGGGPPTLDEKIARLDYRNCQPLWAPDNWAKGNRWADPLVEAPQPLVDAEKPLTLTDDDLAELIGFTL